MKSVRLNKIPVDISHTQAHGHSEHERLKCLKQLDVLDTEPEKSFDEITQLAADLFSAPIALISFVDEKRQWFKSRYGLDITETSREISFCTHAIEDTKPMIVSDALADDRFKNNPLVLNDPNIRFYAGAPLVTQEGYAVGTLCIIDHCVRELNQMEIKCLEVLAKRVITELELRVKTIEISKALEDSLMRESESALTAARWNSVLNHIKSAIVVVDTSDEIIIANKIFYQMFHLNENKPILGVAHASIIENIKTCFLDANALTSYFSTTINEAITAQRGSQIFQLKDFKTVEIEGFPISENSEFIGQIWLYRDVTERIQNSRLIETQKEKLIESNKLKALGEMAEGIAHEISNPLSIIQGKLHHLEQLAQQNRLSPTKVSELSVSIANVVHRVVKIIKGLRAFARLEAQEEPSPACPYQIIDETLVFCQEKLHRMGINLRYQRNTISEKISCRPTQISQVILNLINNACDAIEPLDDKWISIEVSFSNANVQICVSNSGPKISQEIQHKIFDLFFTTKPKDKGTGLGLSISKRILAEHGGQITIDQDSEFTKFNICLPVVQ